MQTRESLPNINRLSIVGAAIMLAFVLTQLVSFPSQSVSFSIFGIILDFVINFRTVITFFTAILAAAGMQWLIQSHPEHTQYHNRWAYVRHWIVPILTTLVIGVALNSFAGETYWWAVFILGSLLLLGVFIAEYNVVAGDAMNHPFATVGLTGLSFALYLLLVIAAFSADLRLYVRVPLLTVGALMVIARSIYLRLGEWHTIWAMVNSIIVGEVVVGFHYLPFQPIQNGLLIIGIAYALTSITAAIKETRKTFYFWAEPVGMLLLMILISILWR